MHDLTNTIARCFQIILVVSGEKIMPTFFVGGLEFAVVLGKGLRKNNYEKEEIKCFQLIFSVHSKVTIITLPQ